MYSHSYTHTPPPRAFHATRAKHPPWTCTRHRGLLDTALGCSPVCPSSKSWDAGFCLEFCCIPPALPLQEWKPFTHISYAMRWYYQFWAYFSQVNLINILILKYYIRTRQSRYKIIVKVVLTSKKNKGFLFLCASVSSLFFSLFCAWMRILQVTKTLLPLQSHQLIWSPLSGWWK